MKLTDKQKEELKNLFSEHIHKDDRYYVAESLGISPSHVQQNSLLNRTNERVIQALVDRASENYNRRASMFAKITEMQNPKRDNN